MGKLLVINGADFSNVALDKVDAWNKVDIFNSNPAWLPNYNTGKLSASDGRDDLWASAPINIEGATKIYGRSAISNVSEILFYSELPPMGDLSIEYYIGYSRIGNETIETALPIPPNAKYIVIFDEGAGAKNGGVNSLYYMLKGEFMS